MGIEPKMVSENPTMKMMISILLLSRIGLFVMVEDINSIEIREQGGQRIRTLDSPFTIHYYTIHQDSLNLK
jgi:hypothetical protein